MKRKPKRLSPVTGKVSGAPKTTTRVAPSTNLRPIAMSSRSDGAFVLSFSLELNVIYCQLMLQCGQKPRGNHERPSNLWSGNWLGNCWTDRVGEHNVRANRARAEANVIQARRTDKKQSGTRRWWVDWLDMSCGVFQLQ